MDSLSKPGPLEVLKHDELPKLGIIMPCLNEISIIRESIGSVLDFDYPPDRMVLIVVDGMSDDGTRDILSEIALRDKRVRVLDNPEKLHAPALNRGIEALDCEVVLRVDAHSIYPRDYARLSVSALLTSGADNAGGVWHTASGADTHIAHTIAFALSHPFGVGNARYRTGTAERQWTDTVPFGCWRLSTLKRLGGFSLDIPYGEDDELNARIAKQGGRILLEPKIHSTYIARRDLKSMALMLFRYGFSKPLTALRLARVNTWRQLVPAFFVAVILVSLLFYLIWPLAILFALAAICAHLMAGISIAFQAADSIGTRAAALLPITFFVCHASYGLGYLLGGAQIAWKTIKARLSFSG